MRVSSFSRSARLLVAVGPLACGVLFPLSARAQNAAPAGVTAPATTTPATASDGTSWTTFKGDPQRTGGSSAQVALPLSLQWRYSSDGQERSFLSSPLVLGAPGKQRLYFVVDNSVMCLDAQSGAPAPEWKAPQLAGTASAPLTLLSTEDGDFIVAATQGGSVSAFRAGDGGVEWKTELQNSITSSGPIVVSTARGPRVVVAVDDGKLVALTTKGVVDPKWQVRLGGYGNPPTSPLSLSPNGSTLYVIATDAKLYGVDVRQGRPAWSVSLSSQTSVVPVVAGRVVVTAGFDRIAAYGVAGGAPVWSVPSRGSVSASPAFRQVDAVPTLFYGNAKGDFYALDARDGGQKWKTSLGNSASGAPISLSGAPVVLDNMVLVGTSTGMMLALNPHSGAILWQYRLKTERLQSSGRGRRPFQQTALHNTPPTRKQGGFQLVQNDGFAGGFPGGTPGGGFPGGGFPGGGPGGTPAVATPEPQQFSAPRAISAAPSVVNGRIFVMGDDASVYAFTSTAIDADPPRVVEPSIVLNDTRNTLTALLVDGQTPPSVPGSGPFYFAAQLDDVGSGVDPKSVQVSLDGAPVDAKNVSFDVASGLLTVTLLDSTKGGANLPDGQKILTVAARDYAGNVLSGQFSFFIDNTAPAPTAKRQTRGGRGQNGGNETGGNADNGGGGGDNGNNNGGDNGNNGGGDNGNNGNN